MATSSARPRSYVRSSGLVAGIVACFITVVIACTVALIFAPDGDIVIPFLTMVLGFGGTTVTALITLTQVRSVDQKVDYLANGGMDSKIRAGVADVVRPDLVDPDVERLLQVDREHRAAGPAGHGQAAT